jgi:hypothetical protein
MMFNIHSSYRKSESEVLLYISINGDDVGFRLSKSTSFLKHIDSLNPTYTRRRSLFFVGCVSDSVTHQILASILS